MLTKNNIAGANCPWAIIYRHHEHEERAALRKRGHLKKTLQLVLFLNWI